MCVAQSGASRGSVHHGYAHQLPFFATSRSSPAEGCAQSWSARGVQLSYAPVASSAAATDGTSAGSRT